MPYHYSTPLLHCSTTTPILYYSTTLLLLLSLHYSTFTTITTTTIIHLLCRIHHFKCCVSPSAQPDTFTVTLELFHLNYVNPQHHLQLHLNCVQMLIFYIIQYLHTIPLWTPSLHNSETLPYISIYFRSSV